MPVRKLSRYIDDPVYFLFWPLPEAILVMTMVALGMFFNSILLFTLIGLLTTYFLRRFNSKRQKGYLVHLVYASGLIVTKAKTMPNPYVKRYVE